jgi:hypothetical protein
MDVAYVTVFLAQIDLLCITFIDIRYTFRTSHVEDKYFKFSPLQED